MMASHGSLAGLPDCRELSARLDEHFAELHRRLDVLDRRIEQRMTEMRIKQEEDLMLLKAVSCQLRGRVERVARKGGRG